MALIDTTELLTDPDFVDEIQLIHRTSSVNSYGENVITDGAPVTMYGSVQPPNNTEVQKLPELQRYKNLFSFWVNGPLVLDGGNSYPDILVFKGKRYQIITVKDWTSWGSGWTEGLAVYEEPVSP